ETKPTINGTDMGELEQHTVRIAVHDALDRAVRVVPDWIYELFGTMIKLGHVGYKLPRERNVPIAAVDQFGQRRRQCDRITRSNLFGRMPALGGHQTVLAELRGRSERRHDSPAFVYLSTTGAQITWSIRCAPVASMTSRSKPSAIPLAGGICS